MEGPVLSPPDIFGFDFLGTLGLSVIVWVLFFLILGIFALHGIVVLYHWLRYARGSMILFLSLIVYGGVSFVLLSVLFFTALRIAG